MVAFRHLQYHVILSFTFGYYSLWSVLFLEFLPFPPQVRQASDVLLVMGTPFIIVALAQQMYWGKNLLRQRLPVWLLPAFIFVVLAAVGVIFYHPDNALQLFVSRTYAGFGAMSSVASAGLILTAEEKYLSKRNRLALTAGLLGLLAFYLSQFWLSGWPLLLRPVANFAFFLFTTFSAVWFTYKVKFESDQGAPPPSFDAFVEKYGFTSRESDIVKEIYNGKTNQQIADTLFVSLQTVKDHTSRIYLKAEVKSRAQLMLLMRESL